jgi:hypothetical protein
MEVATVAATTAANVYHHHPGPTLTATMTTIILISGLGSNSSNSQVRLIVIIIHRLDVIIILTVKPVITNHALKSFHLVVAG